MDAVVWTLKDREWLWTQWCGHEKAVSGDGPRQGAVEGAARRSVVGVCMQCGCGSPCHTHVTQGGNSIMDGCVCGIWSVQPQVQVTWSRAADQNRYLNFSVPG